MEATDLVPDLAASAEVSGARSRIAQAELLAEKLKALHSEARLRAEESLILLILKPRRFFAELIPVPTWTRYDTKNTSSPQRCKACAQLEPAPLLASPSHILQFIAATRAAFLRRSRPARCSRWA